MSIFDDTIVQEIISKEQFEAMSADLLESWKAIARDVGPLPHLKDIFYTSSTLSEEERHNLGIEAAKRVMARYYVVEN